MEEALDSSSPQPKPAMAKGRAHGCRNYKEEEISALLRFAKKANIEPRNGDWESVKAQFDEEFPGNDRTAKSLQTKFIKMLTKGQRSRKGNRKRRRMGGESSIEHRMLKREIIDWPKVEDGLHDEDDDEEGFGDDEEHERREGDLDSGDEADDQANDPTASFEDDAEGYRRKLSRHVRIDEEREEAIERLSETLAEGFTEIASLGGSDRRYVKVMKKIARNVNEDLKNVKADMAGLIEEVNALKDGVDAMNEKMENMSANINSILGIVQENNSKL